MFSYFLGSDTFHIALKFGVFSDVSLQNFLFFIAGAGALVYFACAVMFQKTSVSSSESKSLTKGILFKRTV